MDKPDYAEILDKIRWYFETKEAMPIVLMLVQRGKIKIGSYRRLAIMAGAAESDLRELISDNNKTGEEKWHQAQEKAVRKR